MKSYAFRISIAVLTFAIGVSITTAWVIGRRQPVIEPISREIVSGTRPTLEMVFVLDTTGSMGGLLDGAKQRIWGIVNEVMQSSSNPDVRIGLVAYRDRGDSYVTQVLPLTQDLDKVYSTLMDYSAAGGGDGPEDVRRALAEGVSKAGWSQSKSGLAQVIFLVGDAPPHDDYNDETDTFTTAANAAQTGMIVNTIQCGVSAETQHVWKTIANRGNGQYFAIAQNGGVETITTPYDEELSQLATKLGGTYMAYGGGAGRSGKDYRESAGVASLAMESRVEASAAPSARAERAMNKAINTTAYVGDLLQNIENGSVKLDSVKTEDLPDDLQQMTPEERKSEVDKRLAERREIRARIVSISKQRSEYISSESKKKNGGKESGFDAAVSAALKEQLSQKGIK